MMAGTTDPAGAAAGDGAADRATGGGPAPGTRQWIWPDEAACAARARALALTIAAHPELRDATIELHGPLGAGKTTFVRHLLRSLGVGGRVKSPTYTVVEPYRAGDLDIAHFDFYRFEDARELVDAGLRETFAAPGLKLVEWAARAGPWRPAADLCIEIEPLADESRQVQVRALTPRGEALLA